MGDPPKEKGEWERDRYAPPDMDLKITRTERLLKGLLCEKNPFVSPEIQPAFSPSQLDYIVSIQDKPTPARRKKWLEVSTMTPTGEEPDPEPDGRYKAPGPGIFR